MQDDIIFDQLALEAIDGSIVTSVTVNEFTITLAVEDRDHVVSRISLRPEQARSLATFLTARCDDPVASAVSKSRRPTDMEMMEKTPAVRKHIEESMKIWNRGR